jgi:hypothetical protein
MGLLRRRHSDPVLDMPVELPADPAPPADPVADEKCRICERPIVVDVDHPTDLLVALLIDRPGERSWALCHRSCVQRTRGRLPF